MCVCVRTCAYVCVSAFEGVRSEEKEDFSVPLCASFLCLFGIYNIPICVSALNFGIYNPFSFIALCLLPRERSEDLPRGRFKFIPLHEYSLRE